MVRVSYKAIYNVVQVNCVSSSFTFTYNFITIWYIVVIIALMKVMMVNIMNQYSLKIDAAYVMLKKLLFDVELL